MAVVLSTTRMLETVTFPQMLTSNMFAANVQNIMPTVNLIVKIKENHRIKNLAKT